MPSSSARLLVLSTVMFAACDDASAVVEEAEARNYAVKSKGGECPPWECGYNSAEVNGRAIRELNLDGEANADGVRIVGFVAPAGILGDYALTVEDDELVARAGEKALRGAALVGATIVVSSPGLLKLPVPITIAGYAEQTAWADGAAKVPSYALVYPDVDALLGLRADGACQTTHSASWSVNDIDPDAEKQAPMMLHGVHRLLPGQSRALELVASELAFGSDQAGSPSGPHENGVCWGLGSARLLSASGGGVAGAAASGASQFCATYTWRCVATTQGVASCPPAGSDVVLASAWVTIPPGHDGIVLFNARTRIQAGNADSFATALLGIRVDGQPVAAVGMQQLAAGAAQASRTLSASFLSAPDAPGGVLAPGTHRVEVTINVSGGNLMHPGVPLDLPLTWFD